MMQNDIKNGDGKWENEKSLEEAFRAGRWKKKSRTEAVPELFPLPGGQFFQLM